MRTHYHVYKPRLPGRRKNIRITGGTKRAFVSSVGHRSSIRGQASRTRCSHPVDWHIYANEANDIVRLSVGEPSAVDRPGNRNHPFIRSQVSCVELRRQVGIWRNDRSKECYVLVGDMRSDSTRVPLPRTPPPPRSPFTGHLSRSVFFSPPTTLCLKLFHWQ